MKRPRSPLILALAALAVAGCIHVKTDPVNVHMTVDVNIKVDRALDSFFGDLDRKSATLSPAAAPASPP